MNFESVTVALIWPTLIKGKGKWKGSMPVCVLSKKFRFNNNHHQEAGVIRIYCYQGIKHCISFTVMCLHEDGSYCVGRL